MSPEIVGIINLTEDSFSDGSPDVDAAIALGERLIKDGADWLDLGAESSNPSGRGVSVEVELARLMPVIRHFRGRIPLSIDTVKPAVMAETLAAGAAMINDVSGGANPGSAEVLRGFPSARWVLMHSRSAGPRAEADADPSDDILCSIERFVETRVLASGFTTDRLILDPGMGLFLGRASGPSVAVLRDLRSLQRWGLPIFVGVSRKSFLGALTGRGVHERGAATLAAELWAAQSGASYVRTHDVRALRDALTVWSAVADGTSDRRVAPPDRRASASNDG